MHVGGTRCEAVAVVAGFIDHLFNSSHVPVEMTFARRHRHGRKNGPGVPALPGQSIWFWILGQAL